MTTLDKVRDYLDKGSEQVWVLFSDYDEVYQYRRDDRKTIRVYSGDDVIDAEMLFSGLELRARDCFVVLTTGE